METAIEFLGKNPTVYVATVDGTKSRVRPFQFALLHDGKLYFCTGKQKEVYRQLQATTEVEICTMDAEKRWLRVRGEIAFDDSREMKARMFEAIPQLAMIYPSGADDVNLTTFFFKNPTATLYAFGKAPQELTIA